MQEIVSYLVQHPEVLKQVIHGNASLLGVDHDQLLTIIKAFEGIEIQGKVTLWNLNKG
ncbi:competence pheromone ComX [Bacillus paralicheniformis]|uniref:competence pheromone ComX n=1 Tax=Bacillus paralicheniformis TaxID=1648923 RepID=UPI00097ABACF|nr:competence pheromone ComX [Bacillus paralicheniformis]ARA87037.1 competence protein ComX [Bacillus paralicheniformis]MCJ8221502.1 competence pheromone ComX [Bacillus paralicheniformis]MCU4669945.1 competence pheromone ComX [Bacillus paralicheniformis]MCW4365776.1 competence pheromone ComX [Bacillus paralicheniformis]MCY8039490.1 competence pheromone ComX [Bacillus paralicheniformis]